MPSTTAPSTTAPSTTGPSTTATADKSSAHTYLAVAHATYPGDPTAALVRRGRAVCTRLAHGASQDDLVGDLAGRLGSQSVAHEFVLAARSAYCA